MRFAAALVPIIVIASPAAAQPSPQAAVDELLAADRAFSDQAAAQADPVAGFAAMMTEDAVFPNQERGLVTGREAVVAMLRSNPNYAGRTRWRPIRGGVSADGQHGFTFGYAEAEGGDPARRGRRYLAYWVKRPEGWRVAAYRQAIRRPDERLLEPMAPALPARLAAAMPGRESEHRRSVAAAEQAFSDRAQRVGLRAAFTEFGRADAINMSHPTGFVVGAEAIGRTLFGEERTSPVSWNAERTLAASSGDLAITFGTIRSNGPVPQGQPAAFPFFTIWRRDSPDQSWRYIAE